MFQNNYTSAEQIDDLKQIIRKKNNVIQQLRNAMNELHYTLYKRPYSPPFSTLSDECEPCQIARQTCWPRSLDDELPNPLIRCAITGNIIPIYSNLLDDNSIYDNDGFPITTKGLPHIENDSYEFDENNITNSQMNDVIYDYDMNDIETLSILTIDMSIDTESYMDNCSLSYTDTECDSESDYSDSDSVTDYDINEDEEHIINIQYINKNSVTETLFDKSYGIDIASNIYSIIGCIK